MSKAKTAKTASKNNPLARSAAREFFYNGKKVVPVKFMGGKASFMAAQFSESGDLVTDETGSPIHWAKIGG